MKIRHIVLWLGLLHSTAQAFSLLFAPEEVEVILSVRRLLELEERKKHCLICEGIMYIAPHKWTVWINGHPFSERLSHPQIKIQEVAPQHVKLIWWHQNKKHAITLKPNEMYDPAAKKSKNIKGPL